VAVWTGTWVATGGSVPVAVLVGVAVVLILAAAALAVWWARERRSRPRRGGAHALTPGGSLRLGAALTALAGACAVTTGAAALTAHARDPTIVLLGQGTTRLTVTAELLEDPAPVRMRWAGDRRMTEVRVREVSPATPRGDVPPAPSHVRALAQGEGWAHLARGDVVRATGRMDTSFRADPPFAGTLRAEAPQTVERPGGWQATVRSVRASLVRAVHGLDDQARALVPGMAVGDDREMSEELSDAMRTSSLTHLTAVSGSHVAIMLGVVVSVVPGRGWGRALASGLVMAALVAVVGPEPSVVRSVATAGVGMAGLLTRRPGQAQAGLCAVTCAILLADPWSARSFGFALSVLATWGVIGPAAAWTRWTRGHLRHDTRAGRWLRAVVDAAAVPVAAQVLVAPVLLLLNPWLPTWGVVANMAAAPAVAPASLLGLAAACTAPWWPGGGHALAAASGVFTGWIARVGLTVSDWPLARLPWPGGGRGVLALAALALLGVLAGRWARSRSVGRGHGRDPAPPPPRDRSTSDPENGPVGAVPT